MFVPKKVKHRKWHTMRSNPKKVGVATRGTYLAFGSFGLKTMDPARITSNQLEAARKVLSRQAGKSGKMWVRVFPDMPITKRPPEVKLGKGKGDVYAYVAPVKPGQIIFEVDGISEAEAREGLRKAGTKLPLRGKVVSRD